MRTLHLSAYRSRDRLARGRRTELSATFEEEERPERTRDEPPGRGRDTCQDARRSRPASVQEISSHHFTATRRVTAAVTERRSTRVEMLRAPRTREARHPPGGVRVVDFEKKVRALRTMGSGRLDAPWEESRRNHADGRAGVRRARPSDDPQPPLHQGQQKSASSPPVDAYAIEGMPMASDSSEQAIHFLMTTSFVVRAAAPCSGAMASP
jgi:hypothetical protein